MREFRRTTTISIMTMAMTIGTIFVPAATLPAHAQTGQIRNISDATIIPDDVRMAPLDVTLVCEGAMAVQVELTQRQNSKVTVHGTGTRTLDCTGEPLTTTVIVRAANSSNPWKLGKAVASTVLLDCSGDACEVVESTRFSKTIHIRNK